MTKNDVGKRKSTNWNSYWDKYRKLLLTISPLFLGLAALILVGYLSPDPLSPILLSSMFFLAGFMGVIIIVRHEVPVVLFTITGVQAIVEGSFVILLFWGAAAYIILRGQL